MEPPEIIATFYFKGGKVKGVFGVGALLKEAAVFMRKKDLHDICELSFSSREIEHPTDQHQRGNTK